MVMKPQLKVKAIEWCGYSFELLPEDTVSAVHQGAPHITLRSPDGHGSTFELRSVEEAEDEIIYRLGERTGNESTGPYQLCAIQDVFARLRTQWEEAGGDLTTMTAWAQGEGWDEYLTRWRRRIRQSRHRRLALCLPGGRTPHPGTGMEVTVNGAPRLNVALDEVGLTEGWQSCGVGGPSRTLPPPLILTGELLLPG